MNPEKLSQLRIDRGDKRRPQGALWAIFLGVLLITAGVVYLSVPRLRDAIRVNQQALKNKLGGGGSEASSAVPPANSNRFAPGKANGGITDSVLTVSGYIVNRERIELSPRFLGVVKWIGVKKGDFVTNGQVVVLLDQAEYQARLKEAEGRLATAQVAIAKAELDYSRARRLVGSGVEMQKAEDDARLQLESARAATHEIAGQIQLIKTYLEWTVIRSPIDGVVLEKLVDPNELVTPQSFGGTRGPSTALIALADPKDLQVEIELNEADLSKVALSQKCKVSPEAYLDRVYDGYVAEIAPEANRQKGTLQIKVQILKPDKYLTPELSAKVDLIK